MLVDMRRFGAIEARTGGADTATLLAKMAKTISTSNALRAAYQPINPQSVRKAGAASRPAVQPSRSTA